MPINEARSKVRERLMPDFSKADRSQPKEQDMSSYANPKNSFTVDKSGGDVLAQLTEAQKDALLQQLLSRPTGKEFDLNAPVVIRTPHKEFPKAVYHHGSGRVLHVEDGAQLTLAKTRGFVEEPAPNRDYSKIGLNGIAAMKANAPEREKEMSTEELLALEQGEATAAEEQVQREVEVGIEPSCKARR